MELKKKIKAEKKTEKGSAFVTLPQKVNRS